MRDKQPLDYVPMNTGQRLVVSVCILIICAIVGGWAINELAELWK